MKNRILYEKYLQEQEKKEAGSRSGIHPIRMFLDVMFCIWQVLRWAILAVLLSLAGTVMVNGQLRDMLVHILLSAMGK